MGSKEEVGRNLSGIGRSGGGDGGGKVMRARVPTSQSFLKILPYMSTRGLLTIGINLP